MEEYGLYQTLNSKIPDEEMNEQLQNDLSKMLKGVKEEKETEAIYMLIYEHHRTINGSINYSPVGGSKTPKGVKFDVVNFPNDLKWILWKFFSFTQNE